MSTHIDVLLEVVAADVEVRQSVGHQFVERERVRQLVDAFARQAAMRHVQVDQTLCRFRQRRTQVTGSCYNHLLFNNLADNLSQFYRFELW